MFNFIPHSVISCEFVIIQTWHDYEVILKMKLLDFYEKHPQLRDKKINYLFYSEIKFEKDQFVQEFIFKKGLSEEIKTDLYTVFSLKNFQKK